MPGPRRPLPSVAPAARWVVALLLVVLAGGPLAGTAGAHATLESTSPGNDEVVADHPAEVRLTFDEGVAASAGGVTVLDPSGDQVQRGAPDSGRGGREVVQRVARGPVGTYTVSYRVLSDDGHVISGSYVFHVERRTGTGAGAAADEGAGAAELVGDLGRWLAYAGALLAAGLLVLAWWVDGDGLPGLADRRRVLLGSAVATLVGTLLALWGSAAELAAGSLLDGLGEVGGVVTGSRPGVVLGLRVLAAAVLVVWAAVPALLAAAPVVAAVAVAAGVVLPSLGGHASTTSPVVVAVGSDLAHLLSVAVWIGGLAAMVLTWRDDRDRLRRFSTVALVAAPVTVASGVLNAWFHTRSVAAVTDTDYGRLVLAKAVGAVALLVFGWVHRRWLADTARSVGRMVSSFRTETVVAVAVLAVTAVLVGTPPGDDTLVRPVEAVRQAGDTTVRMDVTPARSGANEVHLYFLARDGSLAAVDAAELRVSTGSVAPRRVPLTAITPSHSVASGVELTAGTWRFTLTVVREGVPARTTFEVPIR